MKKQLVKNYIKTILMVIICIVMTIIDFIGISNNTTAVTNNENYANYLIIGSICTIIMELYFYCKTYGHVENLIKEQKKYNENKQRKNM